MLPRLYGQQQFYITNATDIMRVTLTSPNTYTSQIIKHKQFATFISIAIYKNTLYYNDYNNLYKGTLRNDSLVDVQTLIPVDYYPTSLTVNSLGVVLFAIEDKLYSYTSGSSAVKLLGMMPYKSSGDLVFYKGELYMASYDGIVKVNIDDPPSSSLYIPNTSDTIFGLTSVAYDCKTNKIFGFQIYPTFTQMLAIDLDNKTTKKIPYVFYLQVYDAASSTETGEVSGISISSVDYKPKCGTNQTDIKINCFPAQAYTYQLDNTINATGVFTGLSPGTYPLVITSGNGCVQNSQVVVPDFTIAPKATVNKTNPFCENDGQISLTLSDPQSRIGYKGETFPYHNVFNNLSAGAYQFSIINQYDCTVGAVNVQLDQDGPCGTIEFPTAFTPNGDGINDVFKSLKRVIVQGFSLKIFNRWGTLLFSSTDIDKGWDGKYNGKNVSAGTYYWVATYLSPKKQPVNEAGPVTLIR